ncbi:MAG: hypothetical protein ACREP9_02555, partial [Candidatus Dormibacteraceae bacterium]
VETIAGVLLVLDTLILSFLVVKFWNRVRNLRNSQFTWPVAAADLGSRYFWEIEHGSDRWEFLPENLGCPSHSR